MAKGKKKGGRKASMVHKAVAVIGNILIAGPVVIPAVDMVTHAGVDFASYPQEFVYSASGYNIRGGGLDSGQLQRVIFRDAALVGTGLFVKWLNKRIR